MGVVHISLLDPLFNSFAYIPRSRVVGSYGNSVFNLLRNGQTVFHSSCTILYSHSCPLLSVNYKGSSQPGLEASSLKAEAMTCISSSPPSSTPTGPTPLGCPVLLDQLGRQEGGGPPIWKVPLQGRHRALHLRIQGPGLQGRGFLEGLLFGM